MEVTKKQNAKFSVKHISYVCVSGGKKCLFLDNLANFVFLLPPF